ncbi:hypothetical protein [Negadavirga shengliensis]|uniref:Uncharacterized protein n=1 Tax=Negadavirga shengliensis TaxID=1389218 RepID=A0ABV9T4E5_9BACT
MRTLLFGDGQNKENRAGANKKNRDWVYGDLGVDSGPFISSKPDFEI